MNEVAEIQEVEKAPVSERPSQVNDTSHGVGGQAPDRTCRTCGRFPCPYPGDDELKPKVAEDPDFLKQPECWKPFSVETRALEAIRRGLGTSGIEHDDWDFIAHKVLDSLKLFGVLKPTYANPRQNPNLDAVEALIRSIESDTRVNRSMSVHHPCPEGGYRQTRSLAKAMEIGEAIAGIAGVELEIREFGDSREGTVRVDIGDTEISIFYKALPGEATANV